MTEDLHQIAANAVAAIRRGLAAHAAEGVAQVLARLDTQDLGRSALRQPEPRGLPVLAHWPQSLGEAMRFDPQLGAALAALETRLQWRRSPAYTDDILGTGFTANYGWAEIIGPNGFFPGSDFLLGLLMLGPGRHYPDHYHPAPELYWPLTSQSLWSRDGSPFAEQPQGAIIWHEPMMLHATKTREAPLLAAWSWTRDTATPARLKAAT